nr:MAG TPA: hypothetical protein [Caudoviricetes sp.]
MLTNFTHHDIVVLQHDLLSSSKLCVTYSNMWGRGPWLKAEGFFLFMWHYTTIAEYWLNHRYKLFVPPHCRHLLEDRNITSELQ